MIKFFKNKWKYSRINFYFLNLRWNLSFWLKCEVVYKSISYKVKRNDFTVDEYGKMHFTYEYVKKNRFWGYMYKGVIHHDNPGMPIKDRELWSKWKKKNLI